MQEHEESLRFELSLCRGNEKKLPFPFTPSLSLPSPTALPFSLLPLFAELEIGVLHCSEGPECFIEEVYSAVHSVIH